MPILRLNPKTLWAAFIQLLSGQIILRWVVGVAVALLIVTFSRGCSTEKRASAYADSLQVWKVREANAIKQADDAKLFSTGILAKSALDQQRADSLTLVISSIRRSQTDRIKKNDSILASLRNSLPDTCKLALNLAEDYRLTSISLQDALKKATERDSIRLIDIFKLRVAVDTLTTANDSLEKVLKAVPEYKPPKLFGFIPYPTRVQSFVGGLVTGAVGIAIVVVTHSSK
jgi:hypothetical protein